MNYCTNENILIYIEDHDISKSDLARKLGKSKPYIKGLFSGGRNLTMEMVSDICLVQGLKPNLLFSKNSKLGLPTF